MEREGRVLLKVEEGVAKSGARAYVKGRLTILHANPTRVEVPTFALGGGVGFSLSKSQSSSTLCALRAGRTTLHHVMSNGMYKIKHKRSTRL